MTIDTARLRALASAATPGPWKASPYTRGDPSDGPMLHSIRSAEDAGDERCKYQIAETEYDEMGWRDAAYIAAINPSTLIALLDRLEELEGREPEWEYAVIAGQTTLPARFDDLIEAERHARAWSASAEVLRRRKAGEWGPVTGDDDAHDA